MIRKPTKLFIIAFLLMTFTGLTYATERQPPLMNITTIPAPDGNWVYLPEGNGELVIHVATTNAVNALKVWRTPTGTQQLEKTTICEQRGYISDWTCVWRYTKDDTIHDHFFVNVSYENGSATDIINVTRRHTKDHPQ